jgi:RimJ/RimL family protein N-acetyltransferase
MDNVPKNHATVEIIDYRPQYRSAFRDLNYAWLQRSFEVEPFDRIILNDPEAHILKHGGAILFARQGNEIVGTCGLLKHTDSKYELCKVTVVEKLRGRGIGTKLVEAAIDRAQSLGASKVVLATSDKISAANRLLEKLGFAETDIGEIGPLSYKRHTIVMALDLTDWQPRGGID